MVFLFLILFSCGCLKTGLQIHGQIEDEGTIKNNKFIEATDTSGKTNNVEVTGSEAIISDDNIREAIISVLDAMVEAYENKSNMDFMTCISNDFTGDADILEMATGSVIASGNNSAIVVDDRGNLSIEAYGASQ